MPPLPTVDYFNKDPSKGPAKEEKKVNPKWERKMTRIFGEAKAARV